MIGLPSGPARIVSATLEHLQASPATAEPSTSAVFLVLQGVGEYDFVPLT